MSVAKIWNGSEWVEIAPVISGTTEHSQLTGLTNDDHLQYVREDGTRGFSATVEGVDPVGPQDLATKSYVDSTSFEGDEPAIIGAGGNVVISGADTTTVSGFRDEFVAASGSLQSQISAGGVTTLNSLTGAVDISGAGTAAVTVEGQTIVVSGTPHTAPGGGGGDGNDISNALVGTEGITVISGTSVDTIQGFRSEFTSASGSLQEQLDVTISGINDVFAVRLDEVSSTITYVGEAAPGTAEASMDWRIKRLEDLSPDLNITWVSGTAAFDFAWTDRLILTYS